MIKYFLIWSILKRQYEENKSLYFILCENSSDKNEIIIGAEKEMEKSCKLLDEFEKNCLEKFCNNKD